MMGIGYQGGRVVLTMMFGGCDDGGGDGRDGGAAERYG